MNNTQRRNAKDIDLVMWMLILTEYSDNYSKTSGSSWQYYRDEPSFTNAGVLMVFLAIVLRLNLNKKITGKTENNGQKMLI